MPADRDKVIAVCRRECAVRREEEKPFARIADLQSLEMVCAERRAFVFRRLIEAKSGADS